MFLEESPEQQQLRAELRRYYAELLTEVRRMDGRWMASEAHQLDEGPLPEVQFGLDLTAWLESPSVHQVVGPIREVRAEGGGG